MKILFVACYVDNLHFICLNDAPDIKNGEENFLKICDIISGDENCFDLIVDRENKFY